MSHQIRKGAVHFMKEKRAESGKKKKSERGTGKGEEGMGQSAAGNAAQLQKG